MAKDINKEPFDEATLTKLEIFEQYLIEWLPVFIKSKAYRKVMICDFCAGPGQDSNGIPGSPLRILQAIEIFHDHILQNNISLHVILNEPIKSKNHDLKLATSNFLTQNSWMSEKITIDILDLAFQDLFHQIYPSLNQQPNLIFIDQNGIKEVPDKIFQMLIRLNKTDFLFFISSSYMKRFIHTKEFRKHFPKIDISALKDETFQNAHRAILEHYKSSIPSENKTTLFPFTLKKYSNYYGLIFGTKNIRGIDKFLRIAWGKNKINGDANFDIDNDISKKQSVLFEDMKQLSKIEMFEKHLEQYILDEREITNRDIYKFTLHKGHIPPHASNCIIRLKKIGLIEYDGRIGFAYESCMDQKPKTIRVKRHG